MAFSPDSSMVASGVGSETVIWSVADGRRVASVPVAGNPAFDRTGRLAIGTFFDFNDNDPEVWIVHGTSWKVSSRFSVGTTPMNVSITWTNDGSLFTWGTGARGSTKPVRRWTTRGKKLADLSPYMKLKVSSDGRWAALGGKPGAPADWDVRLVDLSTGATVRVWPGVELLDFSKEALYLEAYPREPIYEKIPQRTLVRVDLVTLEEKTWLEPEGLGYVSVLPNGLLASFNESRAALSEPLKIWEFGQEKPHLTLPRFGDASPDGRWLTSGSGVWSLLTGQQVASFPSHGRWEAFSPDGRYLLRAQDGPARAVTLHDLHTGTQRTLR